MAQTPTIRLVVIGVAALALCGAFVLHAPIPQDPTYHAMADERAVLGIANVLNVLSNLPFAIVGAAGLARVLRNRGSAFADPWTRWPHAVAFAGVFMTAFGSAYYHLAPDNARLVWDRLPMTLGFMGLLVGVVAERISGKAARVLLGPLLLLGPASVLFWSWSERQGAGDLRPYVVVQFGSLLVIGLVVMLFPASRRDDVWFLAALGSYAVAKGLETADRVVFEAGGVISGHTLKHLVAAAALGCLVARLRRPVRSEQERR